MPRKKTCSRSIRMVEAVLKNKYQEERFQELNRRSIENAKHDNMFVNHDVDLQRNKPKPNYSSSELPVLDKNEYRLTKDVPIKVLESVQSVWNMPTSSEKPVLDEQEHQLTEDVPIDDLESVQSVLNMPTSSEEPILNEQEHQLIEDVLIDDLESDQSVWNMPTSSEEPVLNEQVQVMKKSEMKKQKRIRKTSLVNYSDSEESNNDFSPEDSDSDFLPSGSDLPISDSSDTENITALIRWKKCNPRKWKVDVTKQNRAACLPYTTKSKECPAKQPKSVNCSRCRFDCSTNISAEDRESICKSYWGLNNYNRQKEFLINHVQCMIPKRRKTPYESRRAREVAKVYYLENNSGKHRVCANFFQKTLCISNGPITNAIRNKSDSGCFEKPDGRGRKRPGNKTPDCSVALVKEHIQSFPSVEAHYVRQTSKRLYLDPMLSILKMYELYIDFCKEKGCNPVKEPIYRRIFGTEFNLSFRTPKKDQCATCSKYNMADAEKKKEIEADFCLHMIRKTECNEAKTLDKNRQEIDPTFKSITFDLQSVLQVPFSAVSTFYYLRKLCIYNLTIYDANGKAFCNVWSETNGKRGSNEIGTIILKYIQSEIPEIVTELSMFSDTCGGQNRNQQMAAALLYAVQNTRLQIIEQKFLESGHSNMECDSMHAAIEYASKNREIFMLRDWIDVFREARSKRKKSSNEPYIVNELTFKDFWDLHSLSTANIKNRTVDEDGDKLSWLKIKCLRYEKAHPNTILYRYDHKSPYKKIDVTRHGSRRLNQNVELKPAYGYQLPISVQKKRDLEKLCKDGLIPMELHGWYQNLPVSSTLPEDEVFFD